VVEIQKAMLSRGTGRSFQISPRAQNHGRRTITPLKGDPASADASWTFCLSHTGGAGASGGVDWC